MSRAPLANQTTGPGCGTRQSPLAPGWSQFGAGCVMVVGGKPSSVTVAGCGAVQCGQCRPTCRCPPWLPSHCTRCSPALSPHSTALQGELRGRVHSTPRGAQYASFLGLPYAEAGRFQLPGPAPAWQGVLRANKAGRILVIKLEDVSAL